MSPQQRRRQALWIAAGASAAGTAVLLYRRLVHHQEHVAAPQGVELPVQAEFAPGSSKQLCRAIKRCRHGAEAAALLTSSPAAADVASLTAAIEVCGRCKDGQQLQALLCAVKQLGLSLTEACYSAAISAFGRCGRWEDAFDLFAQMQRSGVAPGVGSFTAAIGCCGPAGQWYLLFSV